MAEEVDNIRYYDPNLENNVPVNPEDLTMFVDLKVDIPSRYHNNEGNFNGIDSIMGGENFSVNGETTSYNLLTDSFVNVSYTEINRGKGRVKNGELFGINSIDISFSANLFPVVTINFTDIRGMALMNPYEYRNGEATELASSFFESIFKFPYPKFILKVKGYYGTPVSFNLCVSDFNAEFNSETGNYDIIIKFVGDLYGCLVDIPMSYVLYAAYYNKKYWDKQIDNGVFTFDDDFPIPPFNDILYKTIDENNKMTLQGKYINKYANAKRKLKEFNDIHASYIELEEMLKKEGIKNAESPNGYVLFKVNQTKLNKAILPILKKFNQKYEKINDNDYIQIFEDSINLYFYNNGHFEVKKINENFEYTPQNLSFKSWDEKIIFYWNSVYNAGNKNIYSFVMNSSMDSDEIENKLEKRQVNIEIIEETLDKINKEVEKYKNDTIEEINLNARSFFNMVPNVKNVYKTVFAYLDTFLNALKEINENNNPKLDDNIKKIINNKQFLTDFKGDNIPKYPLIAKKTSEKGGYEKIYPGEIAALKDMPEVKLVERIFDYVVNNTKTMDETYGPATNPEGVKFFPVLLHDYMEGNPYLNLFWGCGKEDIQEIAKRLLKVLINRLVSAYKIARGIIWNNIVYIELANIYEALHDKFSFKIIKELSNIKYDINDYLSEQIVVKDFKDLPNLHKDDYFTQTFFNEEERYENINTADFLYNGSFQLYEKQNMLFDEHMLDEHKILNKNKCRDFEVIKKFYKGENGVIGRLSDNMCADLVGQKEDDLKETKYTQETTYTTVQGTYGASIEGTTVFYYFAKKDDRYSTYLDKGYEDIKKILKDKNKSDFEKLAYFFALGFMKSETKMGFLGDKVFNKKYFEKNRYYSLEDYSVLGSLSLFSMLQLGSLAYIFKNLDKFNGLEYEGGDIIFLTKEKFSVFYNFFENWVKNNGEILKDIERVMESPEKVLPYDKNGYIYRIDFDTLLEEDQYPYYITNYFVPSNKEDFNKIDLDGEREYNGGKIYSIKKALEKILGKFNDDTIWGEVKEEEKEEEDTENEKELIEIKRSIYYTLKNINDKWNIKELFEKYKVDGGEFSKISYVDNFFNDLSDKLMINGDVLKNIFTKALDSEYPFSFYETISKIAEDNKALFLTIPDFNNSKVEDMFKCMRPEGLDSKGMKYFFMYPGEACDKVDGGEFLSNKLMIRENGQTTEDAKNVFGINSNINAFGVTFGNLNQNYFKKIKINMETPGVTDYSIANTLMLSQQNERGQDRKNVVLSNNNLWNIYSNRSYTCGVEMLGCVNITPMTYFQLNNIPMFNGAYIITNVSHKISPGEFTTSFEGVRVGKYKPSYNNVVFYLEDIANKINKGEIIVIEGDSYNYNEVPQVEIITSDLKNITLNEDSIINAISANTAYIKCVIFDKIEEENAYDKNRISGYTESNIIVKQFIEHITTKIIPYYFQNYLLSVNSLRRNEKSCTKNSQHKTGYAIDLQILNKDETFNTKETKKLFSIIATNYMEYIYQLLWENDVNGNFNVIHIGFNEGDKHTGHEIKEMQAFYKDGKIGYKVCDRFNDYVNNTIKRVKDKYGDNFLR